MRRLLFVGDISWDMSFLTPHVPAVDEKVHVDGFIEGLGGVACNAAVAASLAGGQVSFLAACGTDSLSGAASAALTARGIDAVLATRDGSICRVVTLVEPHGEKRLLLYPGLSLYPEPQDLERIDWTGIGHVHSAIYGPAGRPLFEMARHHGASWSLDLEPSTFPGGIADLAHAIDGAEVLFVNDRAASFIGGDAVDRLLAMGARSVIRSMGAKGAVWTDGVQSVTATIPPGCTITDTTGAGDCLAGWYLAGRAQGLSVRMALNEAVCAATLSCRAAGAQAGYPTRQEIDLMKGTKTS